jgi:hypothetical protein
MHTHRNLHSDTYASASTRKARHHTAHEERSLDSALRSRRHSVHMESPAFTTEDGEVARALREQVPAAFENLPPDVWVGFIKAYAGEKPRLATTRKHLENLLVLKQKYPKLHSEEALRAPPATRGEFEVVYQVGPVGKDKHGAGVVLERVGAVQAKRLCKLVASDKAAGEHSAEMLANTLYNREAFNAYNRELSRLCGSPKRRSWCILDVKGLGLSHMSPDFLRHVRTSVSVLLHAYPEAIEGYLVINTPTMTRLIWNFIKPFLDAETVSKVKFLGHTYEPFFKKNGFVLDGPLATIPISWSDTVQRLLADSPTGQLPSPVLTPDELRFHTSMGPSLPTQGGGPSQWKILGASGGGGGGGGVTGGGGGGGGVASNGVANGVPLEASADGDGDGKLPSASSGGASAAEHDCAGGAVEVGLDGKVAAASEDDRANGSAAVEPPLCAAVSSEAEVDTPAAPPRITASSPLRVAYSRRSLVGGGSSPSLGNGVAIAATPQSQHRQRRRTAGIYRLYFWPLLLLAFSLLCGALISSTARKS